MCATAGQVTIAEVEEILEVGELEPDHFHTRGIFVSRIFKGERYEKRIERRTVSK
jgi:3-oxoacid CoA-transferase/3-oxoacid CoA-transferase subunit A